MTEYVPHTPRRKMTKARAARIFLREQGRCYICQKQLRAGIDKFQIEHPVSLALGGSDDDADLRVVCTPCHKEKTKADAKAKAKSDRVLTKDWNNGARQKMQGRGFSKAPAQRKASKPIEPKFDGDILTNRKPENVT